MPEFPRDDGAALPPIIRGSDVALVGPPIRRKPAKKLSARSAFFATWKSTCRVCGDPYHEGDVIIRLDVDAGPRFAHLRCVGLRAPWLE